MEAATRIGGLLMQKYYSCDKNASEVVGYERSENAEGHNSAKIKKQGMQNNETENDAFRHYS